MSDVFDRLLRQAYETGQRMTGGFSAPFSTSFAKGPAQAPAVEEQAGSAQPVPPPVQKVDPAALTTAPAGASLPTSLKTAEDPEEAQLSTEEIRKAQMDLIVSDQITKMRQAQGKSEEEPSFWQKMLEGGMGVLDWVERVDATTYGLVKGSLVASFTGRTWSQVFDQSDDQSLIEAAQNYAQSLPGWEQFIGEVFISPFNLIPGLGVGKGVGRFSSWLARNQVAGTTPRWMILRYGQQGIHARVSHRLADTTKVLLRASNKYGEDALSQGTWSHYGIVDRFEALATGNADYFSHNGILKNPEKWMLQPENVEVRGYLQKAMNTLDPKTGKPELDFMDLRHPNRTAAEVEKSIFTTTRRIAAPLTTKTQRGGLAKGGAIGAAADFAFITHRMIVNQMTPFLLLLRPAYTVNNQMMNMTMTMLRHPTMTMKYMLDPGLRADVKALWGMTDPAAFFMEGFGHTYYTAMDAMNQGDEVLEALYKAQPRVVPLLGERKFMATVKDIKARYLSEKMRRPAIEGIPGMKSIDAWVRGVNVAGEQYFRSANFAFSHLKTYNHMMDKEFAGRFINRPAFREMAKYPELMKEWMNTGQFIPTSAIQYGKMSPASRAILDSELAKLPPDATIQDVRTAFKSAQKKWEVEAQNLKYTSMVNSGPDIVKASDEMIAGELNLASIVPEGAGPNMKKYLADHPEAHKFWDHVLDRDWSAKRLALIQTVGSNFEQDIFTLLTKMDNVYYDRSRVISAQYYDKLKALVTVAEQQGSSVLKADLNELSEWVFSSRKIHYDEWVTKTNQVVDRATETAKAKGVGKVKLSDIDGLPLKTDPVEFAAILEQYGFDPKIAKGGFLKNEDLIDEWMVAERKIWDGSLDDTMGAWDEMLEEGRVPAMDWSKVEFKAGATVEVPSGMGSAGIPSKKVTFTPVRQAKIKAIVERLPVQIRHDLKSISIDPGRMDRYERTWGHAPNSVRAFYDAQTKEILFRTANIADEPATIYHELYHSLSHNKLMGEGNADDLVRWIEFNGLSYGPGDSAAKIRSLAKNGNIASYAEIRDIELYTRGGHLKLMAGDENSVFEDMATDFSLWSRETVIGGDFQDIRADRIEFFMDTMPRREIPGAAGTINLRELNTMHNTAMSYAYREGIRTAENDLFNYGMRTNLDWAMSTLMPYPFWSTRFTLHWMGRALDNPAQTHAMAMLLRAWSDESKELPAHLMASPIKLDLPDGSQLRFSPFQWLFPLGYTGLEVLRYGEQANDIVDAVQAISDLAGGYLFPTWEMLGSLDMLGAPLYKSRGQGMARAPEEIIRDLIPQFRLIRGAMGVDGSVARAALQNGLVPDQDIVLTIKAIGDAVNSGEITDQNAAMAAVEALYDRRPNDLAMKYLSKTVGRKFQTDLARYMGLPVSRWYPEQQETFKAQQMLYPDGQKPTNPEIRQKIKEAYPGLEVISGNLVPAGLNVNEEKQWKAAREVYHLGDLARKTKDEQLGNLQAFFEAPDVGSVVTPSEYISRRRAIYDNYAGAMQNARLRADELGAPIDPDEREMFWREVGRMMWPRHLMDDVLEAWYEIEADSFPSTTGGVEWEGFFKAREDFLMKLPPWTRAWLEDITADPSRPDADYVKAQSVTKKYWNVKSILISKDPDLDELMELILYWERADKATAAALKKHPKYIQLMRSVDLIHTQMRKKNPELETYLQKYWGYAPITAA